MSCSKNAKNEYLLSSMVGSCRVSQTAKNCWIINVDPLRGGTIMVKWSLWTLYLMIEPLILQHLWHQKKIYELAMYHPMYSCVWWRGPSIGISVNLSWCLLFRNQPNRHVWSPNSHLDFLSCQFCVGDQACWKALLLLVIDENVTSPCRTSATPQLQNKLTLCMMSTSVDP